MSMTKRFTELASKVAHATGQPITFALCVVLVIVWALSGPLFNFSDTWQLVINTGTTIVTFLMVFLIQNTQNRDGTAIQAKLDELIRASQAKNEFIGIEHLTDVELTEILNQCEKHRPHVLRRAEAQARAEEKAAIGDARRRAARRAKAPARKTAGARA
jgi:low affinity Fe/Cu permease